MTELLGYKHSDWVRICAWARRRRHLPRYRGCLASLAYLRYLYDTAERPSLRVQEIDLQDIRYTNALFFGAMVNVS